MFALQAGAIRNALVQAGMPMRVAQQLSAILSNTAAEYRTGKITQDATPDNLQFVDPDTRKHQLTGIDPLADDPDFRSRQQAETEEREVADQASDVSIPNSAYTQRQGATDDIIGGPYITVAQRGNVKQVSLNVAEQGMFPAMDPRVRVMTGKNFRCEVGVEDFDKIRSFISFAGNEVVWNTQLVNLSPMVVVTLEGQTNNKPVYGTRKIYAWADPTYGDGGNGGPPGGGDNGDSQSLNVVTSLSWTGTSLVGTFANITVSSINDGGGFSTIASAEEC